MTREIHCLQIVNFCNTKTAKSKKEATKKHLISQVQKAKNKECKNCGKVSVLSTAEEGRGAFEFFQLLKNSTCSPSGPFTKAQVMVIFSGEESRGTVLG